MTQLKEKIKITQQEINDIYEVEPIIENVEKETAPEKSEEQINQQEYDIAIGATEEPTEESE